MKSKIISINFLFYFLVLAKISYCGNNKGFAYPREIIASVDTNYIDVCLQYARDLQLVSMVDGNKMSRCFKMLNAEVTSMITKTQPDLFKSIGNLSDNELWKYELSIRDTVKMNNLLKYLNSQHAFPITIHFVWSYFQKNPTKIALLAIENLSYDLSILSGKDIKNISKQYDENKKPVLFIQFNNNRSKILQQYTSESIGRYYGILIRNKIIVYRLIKFESDSILVID